MYAWIWCAIASAQILLGMVMSFYPIRQRVDDAIYEKVLAFNTTKHTYTQHTRIDMALKTESSVHGLGITESGTNSETKAPEIGPAAYAMAAAEASGDLGRKRIREELEDAVPLKKPGKCSLGPLTHDAARF
jgi:hypothetical protein